MRYQITFSLLTFAIVLTLPLFLADKRAKTEDGKEVILRDDGTWHYANEPKKADTKTEEYQGKRGTYTIVLPAGVWKNREKRVSPATEFEFSHQDGDLYGAVICERLAIPAEDLKNFVFDHLKQTDKQAKIVSEEKKTVNGVEVISLVINAKVQGIPLTYMYYLYSGDAGAIQVSAYTGQNLFKEYKPQMETFLNGLRILKK